MIKRNTKIGDVFSVKLDNGDKKFFQLIAFDQTQLNSDVIRVFKKTYEPDDNEELSEIVTGEVEFHTHCVTKLGLKMNLWQKIGNIDHIGNLQHILFRGSSDSGSLPGEQVHISEKWYIWHINDEQFTHVGKLKGENRKAEIGIVVNPYDVIERIKTGNFSFYYPRFE